ncbi:MAG: HAD family hydrolase [Anaerolineales bacterium]
MIELDIPGRGSLHLKHLVMDVNGTIARDGTLVVGVIPRIYKLGKMIDLHLLTADTHGTQERIAALLDLKASIIETSADKADYVRRLGNEHVVAIGNGANDVRMCQEAVIGIAVMGPEGVATMLLQAADVLVRDVTDGMDLLLYPSRLRATLRD